MQLGRQSRCNRFGCSYNRSSRRCPMRFNFFRLRVVQVSVAVLVVIGSLSTASGCASRYQLVRRDTAEVGGLSWFGPAAGPEQTRLERWARAVGPPVVGVHDDDNDADSSTAAGDLTIVSWNVGVGAGRVLELLEDVRRGNRERPIVLLLQEVYRDGPDVPKSLLAGSIFAGRLGEGGQDIETIAAESGLNVYYVPSMRNGSPSDSNEDRGNAILSNLPLEDLAALELPFERQRRVAVAATVSGRSPDNQPWRMRLVSAHLDNMVGPRRLWIAGGGFARARQARSLVDHVRDDEIAVLGGDFNTWFGFGEPAILETSRAFPDTRVTDPRPTFHNLLRLDHLFFRLPDGWTAQFTRGRSRYGSDHWPLVGLVRMK
jgi:endonuclease/exonuclease/phosphatase family metal-dependent hydrolase